MTIVVIDDDPTGSQTVHSCPLLLRWDVDTLRRGLRHPSPLLFVLANTRALPPETGEVLPMTGRELYRSACANCHAENGRGAPASLLDFDDPLPDFTDCNFATREPDADWIAVAHAGGPVRGFSEMMPAFGQVLTFEQLGAIITGDEPPEIGTVDIGCVANLSTSSG